MKSSRLPSLRSVRVWGGLPWEDVRELIESFLAPLEGVRVVVFEPGAAPDPAVMARSANSLLDPFVTLLEVHKLMYFLQEAGEPLKLNYKKHLYGPYAENLRHVLKAIEGHMVSGYADGGDRPGKPIELLPGAVDDAYRFVSGDIELGSRIDRTAELIRGFQTPFGLELLSTVYWVVVNEHALTPQEATEAVHAWNVGKRKFSSRQVAIAYRTLEEHGWLAS
jgi:hypothetical protein